MDTKTMVLIGIGILLVLVVIYFVFIRKPVTTTVGVKIVSLNQQSADFPPAFRLLLGTNTGDYGNTLKAKYRDVRTNPSATPSNADPHWSVSPPSIATLTVNADGSVKLIPQMGGSASLYYDDGTYRDQTTFSVIGA